MTILGIIIILLLGYSAVRLISDQFSLPEKIGLSFMIGLGLQTYILFALDLIGVYINIGSLLVSSLIGILILNYRYVTRPKAFINSFKIDLQWKNKPRINLVWLLLIGLLVYLLYVITIKSLYWPTFSHDSIAGYDLIAKVTAAEGTINNSVYEIGRSHQGFAIRSNYPPLIPYSLTINYLWGAEIPKLIIPLLYISFIIALYALLRQYINRTGAIIGIFLTVAVPEMYVNVSLTLTNLPHALYAATAVICLFLWLDKRDRKYFYLSALMISFNVWTRNEGVLFSIVAISILAFDAFRSKRLKRLLVYSVFALLPFVAWNIYMNINDIHFTQGILSKKLFWDEAKFDELMGHITYVTSSSLHFGYGLYLFPLVLLLNIKNILKGRHLELIYLIVVTWLVYIVLLYQIDYTWDRMKNVIFYSYKRGLFSFMPLVWYYIFTNPVVVRWLERVENYLYGMDSV